MSQLHHLYPPPPPLEKSMKRTNNVLNAPDDGSQLVFQSWQQTRDRPVLKERPDIPAVFRGQFTVQQLEL